MVPFSQKYFNYFQLEGEGRIMNDNKIDQLSFFPAFFSAMLRNISVFTAIITPMATFFGFLALRSHANMLGLSINLHHSIIEYIYEGGVFCTVILSLVILICGSVLLFLRTAIIKRSKRILEKDKENTSSNKNTYTKTLLQNKYLALNILAAFIGVVSISYLSSSTDLLFAANNHPGFKLRLESKDFLRFIYILFISVFTIILLLISIISAISIRDETLKDPSRSTQQNEEAWDKLTKERFLNSFNSYIYIILFLIFTVLSTLSIGYGTLIISNDFHQVHELQFFEEGEKRITINSDLWLISEKNDQYVFYNKDSQLLHLMLKDNVIKIDLKGKTDIFTSQ